MRHKHADLIHAWAEGAEIEIYDPCVDQWKPSRHPTFYAAWKYRIKPTPKPDVVKLYYKVGEMFSEGYTQDIATFSETPGASAIIRASEGK
jgi:hypothetical protein